MSRAENGKERGCWPQLLWKGHKRSFSLSRPLTTSFQAAFVPRIALARLWVVAAKMSSPEATVGWGTGQEVTARSAL